MSAQQHLKLAQSLPPRLLRFFQRFPPPALFPKPPSTVAPAITPAETQNPVLAPTATSTDTNAPALEDASASTSVVPEVVENGYHNPFQPRKNYRTGKWHGPVYGLRKQADLVKLAQHHGVLDLLPYTIKKPEEKEKRRLEQGLRVKGTGVGQKVKGKKWERTMKSRLEERRKAMENMPAMIQEWKLVSNESRVWKATMTDNSTERTRPWLEEVAEWQGTSLVRGWLVWHCSTMEPLEHHPLNIGRCCVYSGLYGNKGRHIDMEFGHRSNTALYHTNWIRIIVHKTCPLRDLSIPCLQIEQ
jgi:large subunit ribosomal protein L25